MKPRTSHALHLLTLAPAIASLIIQSSHAASGTWSASPTSGSWEASAGETNWSTGVATFPGSSTTSNTETATFSQDSSISSISINSPSLYIGSIGFTGAGLSTNYSIGSTGGNSLVLTSNATAGNTSNQLFISGFGRNGATTAITQTIDAPIVLAPQSSTTEGFHVFQNNSTVLSSGDRFILNGAISGGTTTSTTVLQLIGGNTNAGNAVNGTISAGGAAGGVALNKGGSGNWLVTGNNTLGSNIPIASGTVVIPALGVSGGTLTLSGNNTISTSGSNSGNGSLINVQGSATLVLSGTNTLSPVNTFGGAITIGGGGVLSINSFANALGGLTGSAAKINLGASTGSGRLLYTGAGETTHFAFGSTSGNANATQIIDQSGTGLLKINGNASAGSGGTTFQSFTLQGSTTGTGEYAGNITGNYNLTKTGTSTWTLSGSDNSYTGTTTVSNGKMLVNGNITTSIVSVNSGASIGGNGVLGGALTVAAGATLSPGESTGNLTLGNGLTLAGAYAWELAALSTANPGSNFDTVTVTSGSVNITGAVLQLNLGAFAPTAVSFWQTDQTWSGIINNTGSGTLTGSFAAIDNSAWSSLGAFSTTTSGNDVNLVWTAIPEPTSALSAGFAGILMLLYRRRSTRN
jgi:fibronectin-binding autotransporter adhesin